MDQSEIHSADLALLRARIDELEREKAWTAEQHKRWMEERQALLSQVRKLRAFEAESRVLRLLVHARARLRRLIT